MKTNFHFILVTFDTYLMNSYFVYGEVDLCSDFSGTNVVSGIFLCMLMWKINKTNRKIEVNVKVLIKRSTKFLLKNPVIFLLVTRFTQCRIKINAHFVANDEPFILKI